MLIYERYERWGTRFLVSMLGKRLGDAVPPPPQKNRSSISSLYFDPTSIFFPFVR